jgi:hypothetical protein
VAPETWYVRTRKLGQEPVAEADGARLPQAGGSCSLQRQGRTPQGSVLAVLSCREDSDRISERLRSACGPAARHRNPRAESRPVAGACGGPVRSRWRAFAVRPRRQSRRGGYHQRSAGSEDRSSLYREGKHSKSTRPKPLRGSRRWCRRSCCGSTQNNRQRLTPRSLEP